MLDYFIICANIVFFGNLKSQKFENTYMYMCSKNMTGTKISADLEDFGRIKFDSHIVSPVTLAVTKQNI